MIASLQKIHKNRDRSTYKFLKTLYKNDMIEVKRRKEEVLNSLQVLLQGEEVRGEVHQILL